MSELQTIQAAVERTARRRRWAGAWRGCWTGFVFASLFWLVALVCFKVFPLTYGQLALVGLVGLLGPGLGLVLGGWRRLSPAETARWIDVRQRLKERLGTALEVGGKESEWSRLVVRDAAQHAESVDPRQLVPLRLPRLTRWAVLALAVAAGLGFVPEFRSRSYVQRQNDAANIRDTGKQLAELTRRQIEHHPPALEPTLKAMTSVAELGQELSRSPVTRSEAVRELANAAEKLGKQAQELAKNTPAKSLERAARDPSQGSGGQTPEALQKQIEALKKSLGNDKATPEALDKLKAAMEKAQQMAGALPDKNSAAGQAAREQLSQSLAALAQEARDAGQPLEGLEAAIKALEKNQIDQVLKDLDLAANDLEKLRDMAKALSQLQQQAARMGKDLPEQLENGQTDAARQTLEKMVQQLKSSGLGSEQLEKILNEVSKSVDPASEYGKVADHLKAAVKQMQQAKQSGSEAAKSQAAQSLAQAAKELENLAQQMGDMQSLAATLDALGKAQQAIASGQGWGQCNKPGEQCSNCQGRGCAQCKGTGWKHGGGRSPGGVGTWADEEGWAYYPENVPQTAVDNSGVKRPDLDPRGLSDRGPGEASDALKPTKVKGKMSPGGPMPTITLKGVSIKGQSSVKFEEAAAAAQSAAQSALNQDQVPRAYQNTVKEYFGELTK